MNLKIERTGRTASIEVKRFYLPFRLTSTCPTCGQEKALDLSGDHYLSYPKIGEQRVTFCHEVKVGDHYEEHEWQELIELEIDVHAA